MKKYEVPIAIAERHSKDRAYSRGETVAPQIPIENRVVKDLSVGP
jgi:hypothetical protein